MPRFRAIFTEERFQGHSTTVGQREEVFDVLSIQHGRGAAQKFYSEKLRGGVADSDGKAWAIETIEACEE